MERTQYFKYPKTLRDIVRARETIPLQTEDIADQLLYLARHPGKAGVLDYDVQGKLVPARFRDDNEFFKHGQAVRMRTYGSLEDANKDSVPFWIQREEEFARLSDDASPSGISWKGLGGDERIRRYTLVECVEAAKILSRSLSSNAKEDRIILNGYLGGNSRDAEGAAFIVNMASRHQDFQYPAFRLTNVPARANGFEYGIIHKLDTNHNCGKETNRETYFQDKKTQSMYPVFFCAHTIAAYWDIMRKAYKNNPRIETPMAMNPFAMPTNKVLDAYNAARYSAVVWEPFVDSDGKERHRHRPLHEAELEVMLFKLEKQYRHEQPFFARQKDDYARYDWKKMER